jgi:hypothetical protein
MTNDDLVNACASMTFTDGGSIVKGSDGKWWSFTPESPAFDTALEAYQDMLKSKKCIEPGCERKRTGEKYCESHSPYFSGGNSSDTTTTAEVPHRIMKIGKIRI